MTHHLKARRTVRDNIATDMAPVWRHRLMTPLTPRAVREELIAQLHGEPEAMRQAWLDARLTELDHLLDDAEADCLERFCQCEEMLGGNARCSDYLGERAYGGHGCTPLPDEALEALAGHAEAKKQLSGPTRGVLLVFLVQQLAWDGAPTAEQAAAMLGLGRGAQVWLAAVKRAAAELARVGY